MSNSIAIFHGTIRNDIFYFPLMVNGIEIPNVAMDTGASRLVWSGRVAKRIGLQNLGVVKLSGVGGIATGYASKCNLKLGKKVYRNVPCIVTPRLSQNGLFGLKFIVDHGLKMHLNAKTKTLEIF